MTGFSQFQSSVFWLARVGRRAGSRPTGLLAVIVLTAQISGCAWLDTKQRQLALRPTPTNASEVVAAKPGDIRWLQQITAADGQTQSVALWWMPNARANAPALLYLHGTFRNLYRNLPKIEALREAGFSVLAVDYRGWGDSTAIVPSEATINADTQLAWAELQRREPDPARRVVYGHSMGGAVAVALASNLHVGKDYGALVLESTFNRMPDVADVGGGWLGKIGAAITTLEFDSAAKIGRVDAPILMLHGDADSTVPIALGRRLRDAAPKNTRWIEIPGGTHSLLQDQAPATYRLALQQLINGLSTQR